MAVRVEAEGHREDVPPVQPALDSARRCTRE
jgi:hypothetical protein